jgi:hypothetical protein
LQQFVIVAIEKITRPVTMRRECIFGVAILLLRLEWTSQHRALTHLAQTPQTKNLLYTNIRALERRENENGWMDGGRWRARSSLSAPRIHLKSESALSPPPREKTPPPKCTHGEMHEKLTLAYISLKAQIFLVRVEKHSVLFVAQVKVFFSESIMGK